jgi:hypothetical protein
VIIGVKFGTDVRVRWRRVVLIAVGLIVVTIVAVLIWPGEKEPVYQGKKLSEWIDGVTKFSVDVPDIHEREGAVREIGTNALPFLVKWIAETGDVPGQSKMQDFVMRSNEKTGLRLYDMRLRKWQRGSDSAWAFNCLGDAARAASPELIRLSQSTNFYVALRATEALGHINFPDVRFDPGRSRKRDLLRLKE